MHGLQDAYLNILLLLHSTFMLCVVKMPLKGAVGGRELNSNENYIVGHGKSWNCVGTLSLESTVVKLSPCKISIC